MMEEMFKDQMLGCAHVRLLGTREWREADGKLGKLVKKGESCREKGGLDTTTGFYSV